MIGRMALASNYPTVRNNDFYNKFTELSEVLTTDVRHS
jgi:hypothetical protein